MYEREKEKVTKNAYLAVSRRARRKIGFAFDIESHCSHIALPTKLLHHRDRDIEWFFCLNVIRTVRQCWTEYLLKNLYLVTFL